MSVPRYDRDGRRIEDGPRFGPATRQIWESAEEIAERLQSEESDLEEARSSIFGDVAEAKGGLDLVDTEPLSLDEGEELLGRAVVASKHAAAAVVKNFPPKDLADRIAAEHSRAFQAVFAGEEEVGLATPTSDEPGLRQFDEDDENTYYTDRYGEVFAAEKDTDDESDDSWEEEEE
jgi:hypothetical protein